MRVRTKPVIIKLCFGLVQVHACNILRALYRETKLGEDVFPFVSDGVVVAITGFHSNSWAVSSQFLGKLYISTRMNRFSPNSLFSSLPC